MTSFWDLSVDEQIEMAQNDPDEFNRLADLERQRLIDNAPSERMKIRLQSIQNEIDRTLAPIKNPYMRAQRASELMMYDHDTGSLQHLKAVLEQAAVAQDNDFGLKDLSREVELNTENTSVLKFERKSDDETTEE